jgi:hypothetical protein
MQKDFTENTGFYTLVELAELTRRKPSALRYSLRKRQLPEGMTFLVGGKLLFSKTQVHAWLSSCAINPARKTSFKGSTRKRSAA